MMRGYRTSGWSKWGMALQGIPLLFMLSGCSFASGLGGGVFAAEANKPVIIGDVGQDGDGAEAAAPATSSPAPEASVTPTPEPPKPETKPTPPAEGQKAPPADAEKHKYIALTFDDGPDGKYTPKVLDILKKNGIKATFFLVGTQVEKYPDIAKRIIEEGHDIGNHSWSHKDLSKLDVKALDDQVVRTQKEIEKATGFVPDLVRAPYGSTSKGLLDYLHDKNLKHVAWSVDPKDWAGTSVAAMRDNIRKHAQPGGIILLHSFGGRKNALDHTLQLLPLVIEDLKKAGYEFGTVDEMIDAQQVKVSTIK